MNIQTLSKKSIVRGLFLVLLSTILSLGAFAQDARDEAQAKQELAPARKIPPINVDKKNVVIDGYDVVSYFEVGEPQKGSADFSIEWEGAIWYFSSEKHQELFESDPYHYAPQFGGFCAYAVSKGYTAKIDPDAWTIYQDKLYLNYNKSVRKKWQKDKDGNIAKAEENWKGM